MNIDEFEKLIISIGFKFNSYYTYYSYKEYMIGLYPEHYHFYNGSEWYRNIYLNDLILIHECFKQEIRSVKLKGILK